MATVLTRPAPQREPFRAPRALENQNLTVPAIMERLTEHSRRPRYCFMILSLLAEVTNDKGEAGPFIMDGNVEWPVREYLANKLSCLAEKDHRRHALRERVRQELQEKGGPKQPDMFVQHAKIENEIEAQVRAHAGRNVSRCISDMERADLVSRYYAGHTVDHVRKGGRRNAVYIVAPEALAALRTRTRLI